MWVGEKRLQEYVGLTLIQNSLGKTGSDSNSWSWPRRLRAVPSDRLGLFRVATQGWIMASKGR